MEMQGLLSDKVHLRIYSWFLGIRLLRVMTKLRDHNLSFIGNLKNNFCRSMRTQSVRKWGSNKLRVLMKWWGRQENNVSIVRWPRKTGREYPISHPSWGLIVICRYLMWLLLWGSLWRCGQKFRLLGGCEQACFLKMLCDNWVVTISVSSPYNSVTLYASRILNYFYITNYNRLFLCFTSFI